jgi:hypothetical protein
MVSFFDWRAGIVWVELQAFRIADDEAHDYVKEIDYNGILRARGMNAKVRLWRVGEF